MDGDKAPIRLAMLLLAGLNPLDQLIDGRITVDVGEQLPTLTIPSYERGVARLLRYDRHP
ncbi:hypothetical protein [Aeromonas sp. QDB62]|uniref:hypothetical protein n=1 Tax=Aeromonas sp. QDB62 TaxID=2990499 RepID=UPI0022E200B8|nr:hypothetical protein [Aeromonas sp. QDB62]